MVVQDDQNDTHEDEYAVGVSEQEGQNDNSAHVLEESDEDDSSLEEDSAYPAQSDRQQRAQAIKQAIANKQRAKVAAAEADYYRMENTVYRDNAKISEIYESDPEVAEKISRSIWGKSYHEALAEMQGSYEEPSLDIERTIDRVLTKRQQAQEYARIDEAVIDFFIEKDLTEKSPTFQRVLREYHELPAPKTVQQAQRMLEMLYAHHKGVKSKEKYDIDAVPGLRKKPERAGEKTHMFSKVTKNPGLQDYMRKRFGDEALLKMAKKLPNS